MRRKTRLLVAGAVVSALGLGGLLAGIVAELGPAGAATAAPSIDPGTVLSGFGRDSGTATAVARLEGELARTGPDADRLDELGLAYQVRWRETGDAAFLPLSERALRGVLAVRAKDPIATLALGNLALIRHDFRGALTLGREARRRAPYAARPYGVVGDALVELGRYRAAFKTFDRMAALKPSIASYARIAYARELRGDRAGARSAMGLALDAAGGVPEPTAWAHVELAKLDLGDGRVREARAHVDAALTVFPGYVLALEQRARVEAAEGRLAAAVATARRAVASVPLPQFVALLGDLLDREGRTREAARQRATVATIDRLLEANGLRVDLESAVFRADHGIRPIETVRLARRARAARPSIYGDDALGWALARAGRCGEAERWLDRALRLGTRDALLFFHRGYAAGCAGDPAAMRAWYRTALDQSPAFSVRWAPVARKGALVKRVAALAAVLVAVTCAALGRPGGADAHPLGNFTVNHYAGIELAGSRVYVRFVLDLAEIPTYQEGGRVRARGYAAGRRARARAPRRRHPSPARARLASRVVTSRSGWPADAPLRGDLPSVPRRSVVVVRRPDVREPDRLAGDHGLRARRCAARGRIRAGGEPVRRAARLPAGAPPVAAGRAGGDRALRAWRHCGGAARRRRSSRTRASRRGFEALVERGELSPGIVVLSLLVAAFWGAAHALTPGHGKALVAGYLIGTRGRPRDAVLLGATVTATHTAGVFGLGLVTLLLSRFIVPEQLYPWLTLVSGLLVVVGRRRSPASTAARRRQRHPTIDHHCCSRAPPRP